MSSDDTWPTEATYAFVQGVLGQYLHPSTQRTHEDVARRVVMGLIPEIHRLGQEWNAEYRRLLQHALFCAENRLECVTCALALRKIGLVKAE